MSCGNRGASDAYREVHPAQPLPARAPGEKTILTVRSPEGTRDFTLPQLRALRAVEYRTRQPQLSREFTYRGVLLSDLAREAGVSGRNLRFEALNNYGAEVAAADYEKFPVLLAYEADGRPLSIALKGPLTVVFPTHAFPDRFPNLKYGPQWVWYVYRVIPR